MFIKYPVIFLFIIVLLIVDMDAQICERQEVVSSKLEARNSFRVTYYDQCPQLCIKTKWITTTNERPVIKSEMKTVKYCCTGYIQDNDLSNDSHIECKAICMPACKNGYCSTPGVCACNSGYRLDPKDAHNCLPVCDKDCDHGACVAPNECRCDFGYIPVNGTCQPICTEPCENGSCIAPETCECNPGYRKSGKNLRQPYCSNGCDFGFCAAPETCQCNPGWYLTESKILPINICKPLCSKPCNYGVCIAADTCNCWPSYKNSADGICEPECPLGLKLENHKCVAQCILPCGNGTCVSTNVCVCFAGYEIDLNKMRMGITDAPLCVPSCINCDENKGICVAPNVCINKKPVTTVPSLCEDSQNCSAATDLTFAGTTETYDHDVDVTNTSISQEYIESTPHFINKDSSKDPADKNTELYDGKNNNDKSVSNAWFQQHWESIFIPLLIIATAGIIMLLVWRWKPIIIYFKGSSYVIEGEVAYDSVSYAFEDVQISSTNK